METMSREELQTLYKYLENFIASMSFEEYQENKEAFTKVKTLIHQRERITK